MRRSARLPVALLGCGVSIATMNGRAQTAFSDSSLLGHVRFVEGRVRNVSDADLFNSLDLSLPSLRPVREALKTRDTLGAYRAWGLRWDSLERPRYAFKSHRMQVNTETLTDYDGVRLSLPAGSPQRVELMAWADSILRNVIPVWADRVARFDGTVDFNRDLGQSGKYGFHYWLWSRALTVAFLLTGDQRYLDQFQSLFLQWYDQRNSITGGFPGLDIVYYELGLGIRNRLFIEYYLMPHSGRSVSTHERMLKTLLAAGRWLEQLERWEGYRPGNWQIHGSYMLCQLALTVPEFRESASWRKIGLRRLEEHLERDFFADGGHYERCPNNYTLSMHLLYRNVEYLLRAHGKTPPFLGRLEESLAATLDWFLSVVTPTGMFPAFNDSHRGLMPPPVLEEGGRLLARPYAMGVLSRIFGENRFDGAPLPPWRSRHLAPSGFTVFRSGWSRDALYMIINHGPHGGGHTHHDLLSFEMYAYGRPMAVDAGIGTSYDDTLYIPWYKSSRAHSMIVLNDSDIVREGKTGEYVEWDTTSILEYWAGSHTGYEHRGVGVRRRVSFVRPYYWVILDEVSCKKEGDTVSWVLLSPDPVLLTEGGFRSSTEPGIDVRCLEPVAGVRLEKVWAASPMASEPGKTALVHRVAMQKPTVQGTTLRFPVLLHPFRDIGDSVGAVTISSRHITVTRRDVTDHLCFPEGPYDDGVIATDGSCALVRELPGGLLEWAVTGGTTLRFRNRVLLEGRERCSAEGRAGP